ncbi:MAG TPA: glycosyl hydrolase family 18 protein [Candidatus Sabulitectum sp.]|nr:glycosyl hydrolase family 18 protein [Candidatus Sabulitectum sp.]HPR22779.1 glycosyl hydrolase family 18 protein [Candidatus Sabulitectum sp.]
MLTALIVPVMLTGGPLEGLNADAVHYPSVHQAFVEEFGGRTYGTVDIHDITGDNELEYTVYGFLPYWVNQAWLQYDLISVLAVFSVDMGPSGSITNYHGYPSVFQTAMDQAHAAGAEVAVTVTNFSGSSIHSILTTGKATAISELISLVEGTSADGVCIDFENVQSADAENLVTFMEELRDSLPDAHISICTPVVDWGGAFDYSSLAESCDALMIMCYAFAGSWSSVAGPNAPLTGWGSSPESSSNMAWALCDYVRYAPEAHEKLVWGLPYYGHQWETDTQYPHSPGSGCSTLFYTTLAARAATYGALWDEESLTPYYAFQSGGWNQGWYDSAESLELKYDMVRMAGMQGVGIWALGYDGDRPELWDQLEESFTSPVEKDMITDNLENSCVLHGPSSYWHPYTEGGQYHTYFYTGSISSGPDVNWVQWDMELPDSSSSYSLDVFIPPSGEAQVTYHIIHGAGVDSVSVDQSAFPGQWVSLGGPYGASGGLSVTAGDCTGTAGERIVVDAVRFTEFTGVANEGTATVPGGFQVSASPASSFTVISASGGHLAVHDVSGRLQWEMELQPGECVTWNETETRGVYFLSLRHGGSVQTRKVLLIH